MKVAHYLNQFFAGLGGEEAAGTPPTRIEGAVGPGRGLGLDVAVTLACGDDYFGEREDEALAALLRFVDEERPDVLVCGPSFGSGRYGYACGTLAREVARRGIPAVCGMDPESPGVAAAEGAAYIVPTSTNVAGMREALPRLAALARRLAERRGARAARGRGLPAARAAPERASGRDRRGACDRPAARQARRRDAHRGGGVGRAGCRRRRRSVSPRRSWRWSRKRAACPQGNPDGLPTIRAHAWLRYPLPADGTLAAGGYESVHGGFDVTAANADPNRLVPLDVVTQLLREGRIAGLHDAFYTTTGNGTPVATRSKFGQEIADELKEAGVEAVVLSGT